MELVAEASTGREALEALRKHRREFSLMNYTVQIAITPSCAASEHAI